MTDLEARVNPTPGPWTVCCEGECPTHMVWGADQETVVGIAYSPHWSRLELSDSLPTPEVARANAHLIAAAPELLRISKALVHYSKHEDPDIYYLNSLLSELEMVIATAEGRTS